MRCYGLILATLMLASMPARAQQAPQTPATPAAADDKALDGHLAKWEATMKKVETLGAQLTRIDKSLVYDQVQKLTGVAYYMKAGAGPTAQNLALLQMSVEGQKEPKEKYICTGTYIYQFWPDQKEIRYYKLPKPEPGQASEEENNLLSLLFGMKADDAKRRYELRLDKEDANYIYVSIAPRSAADKADFQRARLVLNKSNYMPRQLWFEHANRSTTLWDIPNLQVGMAMDRRTFDAPQAPQGWKLVPGEKGNQIARPASPTPPGK
jgi:TIGR03009 family protein